MPPVNSRDAMNLTVHPDDTASWGIRRFRCAIGRGGRRRDKREGDGATPVGSWPMRRLLYRADRLVAPETALPVSVIAAADGWCDAPLDARYNQPVPLPYPASAETLWRQDGVYDLIVPLGYNDAPVVAGAGSAIFLHVVRDDFSPTEGCVALALADLLAVLREADERSLVIVEGG
jgi:L,D-peptidoglycan transpeptidase YkuD (ErfK/YbiS/YcfS/YnhG family)